MFISRHKSQVIRSIVLSLIVILIAMYFYPRSNKISTFVVIAFNGLILAIILLIPLAGYVFKRFNIPNIYVDEAVNNNTSGFVAPDFRTLRNGYFYPSRRIRKSPNWLFRPIFILVQLYLLYSYGLFYFSVFGSAMTASAFSSLKISLLVVAIRILMRYITDQDSNSLVLQNLTNIKRDLIFDNINLVTARKLAEVSISGLDGSTAMQNEIASCVLSLQKIDAELSRGEKEVYSAENLLLNSHNRSKEDAIVLWEPIRDSIRSHIVGARKIYLGDSNLKGGIDWLSAKLLAMHPDDASHKVYVDKFDDSYNEVKSHYDKTATHWLNLIYRFEGKERALYWKQIAENDMQVELTEDIFKE